MLTYLLPPESRSNNNTRIYCLLPLLPVCDQLKDKRNPLLDCFLKAKGSVKMPKEKIANFIPSIAPETFNQLRSMLIDMYSKQHDIKRYVRKLDAKTWCVLQWAVAWSTPYLAAQLDKETIALCNTLYEVPYYLIDVNVLCIDRRRSGDNVFNHFHRIWEDAPNFQDSIRRTCKSDTSKTSSSSPLSAARKAKKWS